MHLVPGDRVDRYQLVEPLGEGGQGAVWKAEDPLSPGSLRAIKLVALAPARPDDVERVRREARALARLDHPSLVTSHALFEDLKRSLLGIVMDFVDGASLRRAEDDPRLSLRHRAAALRSLARVLAYVHRAGVVHRDLKLDNVLVTHSFWEQPEDPAHLKLVDFGIAKVPGSGEPLTQLDTIIGTPSYLAPEQIVPSRFGTAHAPAADVFAFGMIAYKLLIGGHPTGLQRGATLMDYATAYRLADERHDPWPPLLPEAGWGELLRDCLALRVEARIADGSELERRLDALREPPPVVHPSAAAAASTPTVVASPAAMLGDTVDMPALAASVPSAAQTRASAATPRTSASPVHASPGADAPTRQLGVVHQPARHDAREATPKASNKWPVAFGVALLAAVAAAGALFWQRERPREEAPPPLPSAHSASNQPPPGPLELMPEQEADAASELGEPCRPESDECACCPSGHGCGQTCSERLEPDAYVLRAAAVWTAEGLLTRPGIELCMRRGPTDSAVCMSPAAATDGGVQDGGLPVETFDLIKDGVVIEVHDRSTPGAAPLAQGRVHRAIRRQELCSGVDVELTHPGSVTRVVLFLDPPGATPEKRCLGLFADTIGSPGAGP